MSEFRKYMHVERFGHDKVQNIEVGTTYIFPKIDGSNGQAWLSGGEMYAGNRKRVLSPSDTNGGFYDAVMNDEGVWNLLQDCPGIRPYFEWLVPHTLKDYRDDAWGKFYIIDMYDDSKGRYLNFTEYSLLASEYGIPFLRPLLVAKNPDLEALLREVEKNTYLMKNGHIGEGVVIKNYEFLNRDGNQVWAKIVNNEFKEKHFGEMGVPANYRKMTEEVILERWMTDHMVDKCVAKLVLENNAVWERKLLPLLFDSIFRDLVEEELPTILKKLNNPTINFSALKTLVIRHLKESRPQLFEK